MEASTFDYTKCTDLQLSLIVNQQLMETVDLTKEDPMRWTRFFNLPIAMKGNKKAIARASIIILKHVVQDEGEFMTYRTMAAYHLFLFDREDEWNEDYLTKAVHF